MKKFKQKILLFTLIILTMPTLAGAWSDSGLLVRIDTTLVCLNPEEFALFGALNEYRRKHRLEPVVLSYSLVRVAQLHCFDLATNEPHKTKPCNMHSWSASGPWSACCYTPDHKCAACMWDKPSELTQYNGKGYEIAFYSNFPYAHAADFADDAIASWSKSEGHNNVMVNRNIWRNKTWKAVGVGCYKGYALIWFGDESDPDKSKVLECK